MLSNSLPNDTIAAIATARGTSLTSIVRLSGPTAFTIAGSLVAEGPEPTRLKGYETRRVVLRAGSGWRVDARLLVMAAPFSYTTEDVAELFLPGSLPLTEAILDACLQAGARLAEPGEFTRRAFVNGRIDALQVEGVLAMIESSSDEQRAAAMERLRGKPTEEAAAVRRRLILVLAAIEAYLDFTDEDTESLDKATLGAELEGCRAHLSRIEQILTRSSSRAHDPAVVLLGPPNAGKSSLFGALVPGRRSIVSNVPGTTRDLLEGAVTHRGRSLRLFDAPGIMETDNPLERLALRNLEGMVARVEACVILLDGSLPRDAGALTALERINAGKPSILVLNKADLGIDPSWEESPAPRRVFAVSAARCRGLQTLLDAIVDLLPEPQSAAASGVGIKVLGDVRRASRAIDQALEGDFCGGIELVAMEIREAFDALAQVCAPVTSEELHEALFARFCIGK